MLPYAMSLLLTPPPHSLVAGFTAAQLTDRRSAQQLPVEADDSWVKYVDPDSGYAYYYNEVNYESTYDRPVEMMTNQDPFASVGEGGGQKMLPAASLADQRADEQLPVEVREATS